MEKGRPQGQGLRRLVPEPPAAKRRSPSTRCGPASARPSRPRSPGTRSSARAESGDGSTARLRGRRRAGADREARRPLRPGARAGAGAAGALAAETRSGRHHLLGRAAGRTRRRLWRRGLRSRCGGAGSRLEVRCAAAGRSAGRRRRRRVGDVARPSRRSGPMGAAACCSAGVLAARSSDVAEQVEAPSTRTTPLLPASSALRSRLDPASSWPAPSERWIRSGRSQASRGRRRARSRARCGRPVSASRGRPGRRSTFLLELDRSPAPPSTGRQCPRPPAGSRPGRPAPDRVARSEGRRPDPDRPSRRSPPGVRRRQAYPAGVGARLSSERLADDRLAGRRDLVEAADRGRVGRLLGDLGVVLGLGEDLLDRLGEGVEASPWSRSRSARPSAPRRPAAGSRRSAGGSRSRAGAWRGRGS